MKTFNLHKLSAYKIKDIYHGTSLFNAPNILQNGLIGLKSYLTADLNLATRYALWWEWLCWQGVEYAG